MDFSSFDEFLQHLAELHQKSAAFVLCYVVEASGSTPRNSGAKMLVSSDYGIYGTVGGGVVESEVINNANEMIKTKGSNRLLKFELNEKGKGLCGGSMTVFLEGFYKKYRLIIFGAGHVSEAVCDVFKKLGYHITIFDNREERLNLPQFDGLEKIYSEYDRIEELIKTDEYTDILIMTPNHKYDFEITNKMLRQKFRFFGLIGSKRKRIELHNYLKLNGFSEDEIRKVRIPVGLEIGSKTPYEIAISIAAELISLNSSSQ